MNTRQSWIIGAAIVIGCLILSLSSGGRTGAEPKADPAKVQQWEYNAVDVYTTAPEATEQLNKLAAQGWEYAGPVFIQPNTTLAGRSLIAFRRPKR
jgi:hypothetical protein